MVSVDVTSDLDERGRVLTGTADRISSFAYAILDDARGSRVTLTSRDPGALRELLADWLAAVDKHFPECAPDAEGASRL